MENQHVITERSLPVRETNPVPHGQERIVTQAERAEVEALLQPAAEATHVPTEVEEVGQ